MFPIMTLLTVSLAHVAQDLPEFFNQLIAFIMMISTGIWGIIVLTGFGKWLADRFGTGISGNQVRFVAAIVGLGLALVAGLGGASIPGVGPMPLGQGPQAWIGWLMLSAAPMILFATAFWKAAYKPEPDPVVVVPPQPLPDPTARAQFGAPRA